MSAFYHDSACALLRDGELVAAASEERFTRVKYDPRLPLRAFHACLDEAGLDIVDVDAIAYYESPQKKLGRQLWAGRSKSSAVPWLDAQRPEREIREVLGFDGPIHTFEHHQSHAASAYYCSGFTDAACFTVDAVGEWATTTYGRCQGSSLELFEQVEFPDSLGILYSAVTSFLGFRVNDGEYKVMGLAPYGTPRYVDQVARLIESLPRGQYRLRPEYFDFLHGDRMYAPAMADLFGMPARAAETSIQQAHQDLAHSVQIVLEQILFEKVRWLKSEVPSDNLCMAGGVALNCVANGKIARQGPFTHLFVQPAAGDAGGSIGAAMLAHVKLTGERPHPHAMKDACLGPRTPISEVARVVAATGIAAEDYRGREPELINAVVDRMLQGKVIGWYHGRMEMGPRALGARSIVADPRDAQMRERLNALVKKREAFRPFAPSVLARAAAERFHLDHPSPFMLETCQVKPGMELPAITHVDGSARPQTVHADVSPRYHALIEEFARRTGVPLVVNTSFNIRGEPVICSPVDALLSMVYSGIDVLVLEDFVIDRSIIPASWATLVAAWDHEDPTGPHRTIEGAAIPGDVYTFL